jgi:histidinol-phosphate aminotransferase
VVKLNTNENPYPPSARVVETLRKYDEDGLRRYPDPVHTALRTAAGQVLGVPPEFIVAGNGSDEILAMILRAFLDPGERVAYPYPTYSLYPTLARMHGGQIAECPAPLGGPKVEAVLKVDAKITFIASPNSPDGAAVPASEIQRLCAARAGKGIVVADEAYVDFSEGGVTGLVQDFDNLIVTRTLSKSYSLAGLRLGIGVANRPLIDALWAVKDSYNVGSLPQALAVAALQDQACMRSQADRIVKTREETSVALQRLGWRVYPSQANFIFAEPSDGNAAEIYQRLAERQIFVRYFNYPPLDRGLRISIGSDDHMRRFLDALGG